MCHCVHMFGHKKKDVRMLPTPSLKVAFGHQKMLHTPFQEWDNSIESNKNKFESLIFSKSNIKGWEQRGKNKFEFFKKTNLKKSSKLLMTMIKKNPNILHFSQKPISFGIC